MGKELTRLTVDPRGGYMMKETSAHVEVAPMGRPVTIELEKIDASLLHARLMDIHTHNEEYSAANAYCPGDYRPITAATPLIYVTAVSFFTMRSSEHIKAV